MPVAPEAFTSSLFARVLAGAHHNEPGVEGDWGMIAPITTRRRAVDALEAAGARAGMARRHYSPESSGRALAEIAAHAEGLARTSELLADDESRDLLLDILATRVLGDHHASLPVTQRNFRDAVQRIDADWREAEDVARSQYDMPLHRYRVAARGGEIRLLGVAFMVHEFFGEEQYAFERAGVRLRAGDGDVVVDGGGGWGETALYFADLVGPSGRVLGFEFSPQNLGIFERNMELNPRLRDRVEIVPHPVWDAVGEPLRFDDAGGQTSVAGNGGGQEVLTETIDHVAEGGRVDFIKLDVEGAEMAALRGAEQTIRAHRPTLALSIYHSIGDFVDIPAWVDGLGLGYRLYLDHRWPGPAETILFAQPA
ncbi:MAG TPA: FkbM family methyltransferase [Thermoleophilaceae bacterium]|nr:FkbM family methyltransferase [Thermoleophilaceae bacterium]